MTGLRRFNLKRVGNVLPDVVFFALIVKFGLSFIFGIARVSSSLLLLPVEVSVQVIKTLRPQLDNDEAGCIFQSLGRLVNLKVPDVQSEFHIFSPQCQKCIGSLKWYCDENHIFPIKPILKHKQVACMTRKMLFTIFKYLFSFQRYLSF